MLARPNLRRHYCSRVQFIRILALLRTGVFPTTSLLPQVIDDPAPLDGLTSGCHYRFTAESLVK